MFLNRLFLPLLLLIASCSQLPTPPPMTVHEQLRIDTVKAKGLITEFEKQVKFENSSTVSSYLASVAKQLVQAEEGMRSETVIVKIHQDAKEELKRPFSFPGVLIAIPKSFLMKVNFENELAALIALELAQIKQRDLALELERRADRVLFGTNSLFRFSSASRGSAIEIGTRMMYSAGYDPRGMVALVEKYPALYLDASSPAGKKELEYYVKQAQKAKNGFMPSMQPIVRSNSFLQMKKNLKGSS